MSTIRAARVDDFSWMLELGARHETETSPLDARKLAAMAAASYATNVFDDRGGYLIAFDRTAAHDSVNFLWFRARFDRFIYVDRVVVAESARRQGRARRFYEDIAARGRRDGHTLLCCEVNLAPPNPASDAFHAELGFTEAGRSDLGDAKIVRYLTRPLS